MCRRRNATPCGLATFGLFLVGALFLVSSCPAQVPDPINAAQSPMPGSEHHYIGMGGEIVEQSHERWECFLEAVVFSDWRD